MTANTAVPAKRKQAIIARHNNFFISSPPLKNLLLRFVVSLLICSDILIFITPRYILNFILLALLRLNRSFKLIIAKMMISDVYSKNTFDVRDPF